MGRMLKGGIGLVITLSMVFLILVGQKSNAQSTAQGNVQCENKVYNPIALSNDREISDTLSDKDIPTGEGGFARDYLVKLNAGDQVAIDLTSDNFDTRLTLMAADGTTVAENDDGSDGSTNSLIFSRISESGTYIVRVRAFGEASGGKFKLKVSPLRSSSPPPAAVPGSSDKKPPSLPRPIR